MNKKKNFEKALVKKLKIKVKINPCGFHDFNYNIVNFFMGNSHFDKS